MHKMMVRCALALAIAATAPTVTAHEAAPDAMLGAVAKDVLARVKDDRDANKVAVLVETRILPLFDFERMTRSAMARSWRIATPMQRTALVSELKTLLARSFSAALMSYQDEAIDFAQTHSAPGDDVSTVRSNVKRSASEAMRLDYDLERTPSGWRICDVKVAGVRLVTTYRDAFAEKVREAGVDGLIRWLTDMNRRGDSRFASVNASSWETSQLMYAILRGALQRM